MSWYLYCWSANLNGKIHVAAAIVFTCCSSWNVQFKLNCADAAKPKRTTPAELQESSDDKQYYFNNINLFKVTYFRFCLPGANQCAKLRARLSAGGCSCSRWLTPAHGGPYVCYWFALCTRFASETSQQKNNLLPLPALTVSWGQHSETEHNTSIGVILRKSPVSAQIARFNLKRHRLVKRGVALFSRNRAHFTQLLAATRINSSLHMKWFKQQQIQAAAVLRCMYIRVLDCGDMPR